ncbi:MAG TPA: AsmA family protein, partial [Oxalicibacterium sp.]|nr:AsmA family protein [Oxalicibacterium sp.]
MRKWQRWTLWGVAGLALLLIAASLALHALVDEARLKAIAHDKVQQTWGRDLQVQSLHWQLLPSPRLSASGVTVSNATWAQDRHFLEIDDVRARLALWPLLAGKVVIRRLDFQGLKVNIETDTNGRRNWDLPQTANDDSETRRLPQTLQQVGLTDLRVADGRVVYRDGTQKPVAWQVTKLAAEGDRGLRNVSFDVRLARDGHPLQFAGTFDQLSRIGAEGAHTKGSVSLHSGEANATLEGTFPLTGHPRQFDVRVAVDAQSLKEMFGFFAIDRGLPAAFKASAQLRGTEQGVTVSDAQLQLGKMHASGSGQWQRGARPSFDVHLRADHVDMEQTPLDAGMPPLPPKPAGELFHDKPLPWPLLAALDGMQGKADVRIAALVLRSDVVVSDAAAELRFDGDRMTVSRFGGKLLGGSVDGDAVFEAKRQAVQLNLRLHDTQLGAWFKESGKKIDMSGGAMQVDTQLTTRGASMKELAAGISGPMNIRIGPAKILSEKAGRAEFWMNGLFSARDADHIDLSCASLRLPFQSGIARGDGIAGARSEA